ncbi:MAG: type V CRISPR-associated protein Cas12b [Thermodesulfobacteriota bacterium]
MADISRKLEQRAYTMRLQGMDRADASWRQHLWETHLAVNKGAKVFSDWLLTLRGGLDHTLADVRIPTGTKKLTVKERCVNRILLALSWLSVESAESELELPKLHIVAYGKESQVVRNKKVLAALRNILESRDLTQRDIDAWINDCETSLCVAIRDSAVWIDRSAAFDEVCRHWNRHERQEAREDARTVVWYLLTDAYLALPRKEKKKAAQAEDAAEAVTMSGKRAGHRTRHLFSHIFGKESTQGFGKPVRSLKLRNQWREYLGLSIAETGIPLSDPGGKSNKGALSPTEIHREMFTQAASRLGQIWTKQKQQECERQERMKADAALRKFEDDQAYRAALDLLEAYCSERGQVEGSLDQYAISQRAISVWGEIVAAWNKINESDPSIATQKRKAEVVTLQGEQSDAKFGNVNLYLTLAEPEYEPVWRHAGKPTSSILETYVNGWKARFDAVRLKVAAFRHPDPCFHPVFCQFGVSRPQIWHSRLERNLMQDQDPRVVRLRLWTGKGAKDVRLLGLSKRIDAEIGTARESMQHQSPRVPQVSRRTRLGIAAVAKPDRGETFRVAHVFEKRTLRSRQSADRNTPRDEVGDAESQVGNKTPAWNGTLKADRGELEAIGRLIKSDNTTAKAAVSWLRWWLIVSLELEPMGPWFDYIERSSDKSPFLRTVRKDEDMGKKRSRGTAYISWSGWPHEESNKPLRANKRNTALELDSDAQRKGMAALILSRLPSLRVLSVDLGHRYAAACAVWDTVTAERVEQACRAANHSSPTESDVYLHLRDGKRKVVYRRIGPSTFSGQKPNPAPWARLERQFLIKLQGEDQETREASNEEIWAVHQMEYALGRPLPLVDRLVKEGWGNSHRQPARLDELRRLGWRPMSGRTSGEKNHDDDGMASNRQSLRVDKLMSSALRTMRLALKRHGDRARIAFAMTAEYKPMPGARKYFFGEAKEASAGDDDQRRRDKRVDYILDTLLLWHELANSGRWRDGGAKALWDDYIAKLPGYQAPEEIHEGVSAAERKDKQNKNRHALHPVAIALATNDNLRKHLHDQWEEQWTSHDKDWHMRLKWFKHWILPKGNAAKKPSIRRVGGLSLTRLATLTEFRRKVQVGFFTRLHPDGTRHDIKEHFDRRSLATLEHLREQRVKQLASRIVEAALGVGREHVRPTRKKPERRCWCGQIHNREDPERPCPLKSLYQPCHAVVVEYLADYRPKETRTRRENRQLMRWCAGKLNRYLSEACRLSGLYFRQVDKRYTSWQDSRTGAPGYRCQDVPLKEFMQSPLWRKQVAAAEKKRPRNKNEAGEGFLSDLNERWKNKSATEWKRAGSVRIPLKSGEIFVSAKPCECEDCKRSDRKGPAGIQADLNAAANIGLRALMDPDWPGRWWYVPCWRRNLLPVPDKTKNCPAIDPDKPLKVAGKLQTSKKIVNLWRDPSTRPIQDDDHSDKWMPTPEYWDHVLERVIENLRRHAGLT